MGKVVKVRMDQLALSIRDCLAWCRPWRNTPPPAKQISEVFRSHQLAAAARAFLPESCHTKYGRAAEVAFNEFLTLRNTLVEASGDLPGPEEVQAELHRPKSLIVLDWRSSLFDGAATPETDGFLDDDYIPPWDTWLVLGAAEGAYTPRCLVSWVPPWMADGMDSGIEVDPASCLSWCSVSLAGHLHCRGWGKRWDEGED